MPIYLALQDELKKHDLLHADETELQVLHETNRTAQQKSYMWLFRTSGDAEHPIVLYDYAPGRGQEYPNAFLKGFRGYLQTDGYSGYHGLEGVTHVGCWAHARRKFDEACRAVPKGKRSPTAEQGVAYCTQLFELEKEFKDLSPEERKKQRLKREKPVLDAMLAWANTRNAAPKRRGCPMPIRSGHPSCCRGTRPRTADRLNNSDPSWACEQQAHFSCPFDAYKGAPFSAVEMRLKMSNVNEISGSVVRKMRWDW